MSQPLSPLALFRLSVLGPLASRGEIKHGEVKQVAKELSKQAYNIPGSRRVHISEQTILRWYYAWKKLGIKGLEPKTRQDKGQSKLPKEICELLLEYKKDNPHRSINTLRNLLKKHGIVSNNKISRSAIHRFLKENKLSKCLPDDINRIERRAFEAKHVGDIWYGDVMHGPRISTEQGMRKTYLVSLMDDASRFIVHSQFCFGETAVDIEGVLKEAVLKRGLPHKLVIDNGAAYRSGSLQSICASLEIRLIYCRPYEPEGKGKLERFHRTFRDQFLSEIAIEKIGNISDLNARVTAWLDEYYHKQPHAGLGGKVPIERLREDLVHIRQLGFKAENIDNIFYHRIKRRVRKDGTVSWNGMRYETSYQFVDHEVTLVIDPHENRALKIESLFGDDYGPVTPLDKHGNLTRTRHRPIQIDESDKTSKKQGENLIEIALKDYEKHYG